MNIDNVLRAYAQQDLKRLCPAAHYWMRDHNPQADRELTEPLLHEPARFALTPRELAAAHALADLATYEIRSRAIWSEAFPVRDTSDTREVGAMSEQQTREIDARREVYRRSALVYARMLNDALLIESFQPSQPAEPEPPAAPVVPERVAVADATGPASAVTAPTTGLKFSMTKAAMLNQHRHEWPTIERDMADASKNGLSAAKAGARDWNEATALEWARANNKLKNAQVANLDGAMRNLPSRRHRMDG